MKCKAGFIWDSNPERPSEQQAQMTHRHQHGMCAHTKLQSNPGSMGLLRCRRGEAQFLHPCQRCHGWAELKTYVNSMDASDH